MSGRLESTLATLRADGKKALVAYVCMGDPTIETSIEVAVAAADAGADVLELGVPFSDPIADGPVIARASARAIKGGAGLTKALDAARAIRARVAAPLVLFSYYNPLFVRGPARSVEDAARAGVDALLIVDLPPEEGAELRAAAKQHGLPVIPLLSPTTDDDRKARTLAGASGFVYYVSVTGVTGSAEAPLAAARDAAAALRAQGGLPVVVGFGIDSPEKARLAAGAPGAGADGVVVGTAIVKRVEESADTAAATASVATLVRSLRAALDEG